MTRGLQFLILFFGSIALGSFFRLGMFPFWIPIIWFYGPFDALQLADQEVIQDKPLVQWQLLRGPWTGVILIVLGLLLMVDDVLPSIWHEFFSDYFWGFVSFRTALMAVVFIAVGIVMLRGKKVTHYDRKQQ